MAPIAGRIEVARERSRRRVGDSSFGYDDRIGHRDVEFLNPYPYMSDTEARVHLALEHQKVPFSWRWFDAWDQAPHLQLLMPDYAPEFTLKEYKTVIAVQGGYFSELPGIIDRMAMAQAILEYDGWKFVVLYEQDILKDVNGLLSKQLPWFKNPPVQGLPRLPPIGVPDFMEKRRQALSAFNLRRGYYALERQKEESSGRIGTTGRRRKRLRRERNRRGRNRESR